MKEVNIAAVEKKIATIKKASDGAIKLMIELRKEYTEVDTFNDNGSEREMRVWTCHEQRRRSYDLNNIRLAYDAKSFELEKLLSTYQESAEAINKLMTSNTEVNF